MVKLGKRRKIQPLSKIPYVSALASLANAARGVWINKKIVNRAAPEQLLELWSFEGSPYTRLVREVY